MKVRVLTSKIAGDAESLRTIDVSVREQRQWIASHTVWAHHNNRAVTTWNAASPDDAKIMQKLEDKYGRLPQSGRG